MEEPELFEVLNQSTIQDQLCGYLKFGDVLKLRVIYPELSPNCTFRIKLGRDGFLSLKGVNDLTIRAYNLLQKRSRKSVLRAALKIADEENDLSLFTLFLENLSEIPPLVKADLLLLAIELQNLQIVELLLKHKADPNLVINQKLPLVKAVKYPNIQIIKALLDAGAHVDGFVQHRGFTPLIQAIRSKNLEAVQLLLNYQADSNFVQPGRVVRSPLHHAIEIGDDRIIRLLLRVTNLPLYLNDAFSMASSRGRLDLVEEFFEIGRTSNIPLSLIDALVQSIFAERHVSLSTVLRIVDFLLEQGADINGVDHIGLYPLSAAAEFGSTELVKNVIERGALIRNDPNVTSPLLSAVFGDNYETVEFLLSSGIALPVIDLIDQRERMTPLMLAAKLGNKETVRLLIKYGANPNIVNEFGHKARYYAWHQEHYGLEKYLKQFDA